MPLMHSESLQDHDQMISLLQLKEVPDEKKSYVERTLKFAIEHQAIIQRFGRYPHRNRVLKKESTEKELAYLNKANTYGQ